jgi:hypothetical protein
MRLYFRGGRNPIYECMSVGSQHRGIVGVSPDPMNVPLVQVPALTYFLNDHDLAEYDDGR